MKTLYYWACRQVHREYAPFIFASLVFIEGFFFVPVNTLLSLFCLEHRSKSFLFAAIATVASVFGGLVGYLIGAALWETIGNWLITTFVAPETFAMVLNNYQLYQVWAVLLGGFLPIPYKAITLSAGFCKLPLMPFLWCTLMGKGIRFFMVATIVFIWGDVIQQIIDRYFYYLVALGVVILAISWWIIQ